MSGDRERLINILTEAGIDIDDARFEMRLFEEKAVSDAELESFVSRRANGEPAAYILGEKDFYRDTFMVVPGVLIPRSDTEIAVETALCTLGLCDMPMGDLINVPRIEDAGAQYLIADLCTGSGCLGISVFNGIIRKGMTARCVLSDISETALTVAKTNARNVSVSPSDIKVIREDVLADETGLSAYGEFDLITANPPYIDSSDMKLLPSDVSKYEPHLALFGGEDGLDFYSKIAAKYMPLLKHGGAFIVEHGYNQGDAVRDIFTRAGYSGVLTVRDYGGNPRVTIGIRRT